MTGPGGAPTARLLLTGDELLRGFIQDANSGFIAARLRDLGIELDSIRIVGDDYAAIEHELRLARDIDGVDLVVVTGGLGPTHDDRTSEAVATALGVALELREDALEVVESRVRAYGRMRTPEEVATFTPGNRKQATIPVGATWVDPLGTAPGYVVAAANERAVAVLPGPPAELRHAWSGIEASSQLLALQARVGERHERLVRLWGIPESRGSQVLVDLGHEDSPERRVTICARDGELEVAVRGSDVAAVDTLVEALCSSFDDAVFAVDDHRAVVDLVGELLRDRGWTLAFAESCTGGLLGAMVTELAGSSEWFLGSAVTYSNAAKVALVGVAEATLEAHGAVSEATAREMARGARVAFGADVAIAVTGIAGPGGGTPDKPVGTVHVAIATPEGEQHLPLRMPGNRAIVRRRSCAIALHALRRELSRPT
ncbi:MAG: Competence/damage-inducible CinA-like protein [Thermoleophilia bacterium]|nr:Competence/damage-inducible CinA-like protein [Thermoleophilia bacterium]